MDKINGQRTSSPGSPAQDSETNPKKSSKWQKFKALFHRQKAPVTPHKAVNSTQKPSGIEKFFPLFFQGKSQAKSHVSEQNHKDRYISNIHTESSRIRSPQPAIEGQTYEVFSDDDEKRTINALKFFESIEGRATSDKDLNETVNILTSALNNALEIRKKTSEEKNLQASAPPSKTQIAPTPEITWKTARTPNWETAPNPALQLSSSRTYSSGFSSLATRLSAKKKTTTPHEEITLPTIFSSKVSAPLTKEKLPHAPEKPHPSASRRKKTDIEEKIEAEIEKIVKNAPAPTYLRDDYLKDSPKTKAAEVAVPEEKYAKLHRDRAYMESSDNLFGKDIANIGTLLLQPRGQFIAPRDLNEIKILKDAFQIYYEEGIKAYPNSFAQLSWPPTKVSNSLEDLSTLLTNLEKISSLNTNTQALIEKAKATLRARIHGSR